MTRVYSFGDQPKPIIKSNNDTKIFISNLMKKSSNVNGDQYSEGVDQLKKEIESGKSFNSKQQAEFLMHPFPNKKDVYHNGYLNYLMVAWYNDCGIEIGPWHIWNVILHQLCQIVNKDPEIYREVFTRSKEKIEIKLYDNFSIQKFIDGLKDHLPFDINNFLPDFDKSMIPENYTESIYGLFGEMVKNYYSCMILGCGIPKVRILGSKDEWKKIVSTLGNISDIFLRNGTKIEYMEKCKRTVENFIKNLDNKDFWKDFFYIESCGSGSQEEIKGHILSLLSSDRMIQTTDIIDMISRYPFVDTRNIVPVECFYISGIMYSTLDSENILVPEYHCNISYIDKTVCNLTNQEIDIRKRVLDGFTLLSNLNKKYESHCTKKMYWSSMEFDGWNAYTKQNETFFKKIKYLVPDLLKFMVENNYCEVYNQLMSTLNLEVYRTMLSYCYELPFKVPKPNGHSYCYLDPIIDYNAIVDIKFGFLIRILIWIEYTARIDNDIKRNLLANLINDSGNYHDLIYQSLIDMTKSRITCTKRGWYNAGAADDLGLLDHIMASIDNKLPAKGKGYNKYEPLERDLERVKLFFNLMGKNLEDFKKQTIEFIK